MIQFYNNKHNSIQISWFEVGYTKHKNCGRFIYKWDNVRRRTIFASQSSYQVAFCVLSLFYSYADCNQLQILLKQFNKQTNSLHCMNFKVIRIYNLQVLGIMIRFQLARVKHIIVIYASTWEMWLICHLFFTDSVAEWLDSFLDGGLKFGHSFYFKRSDKNYTCNSTLSLSDKKQNKEKQSKKDPSNVTEMTHGKVRKKNG